MRPPAAGPREWAVSPLESHEFREALHELRGRHSPLPQGRLEDPVRVMTKRGPVPVLGGDPVLDCDEPDASSRLPCP